MAPDLKLLKAVSKENLSRTLRILRGKKYLIIDSKITATLDLIANFQFLKDHGVEKVYALDKGAPVFPNEAVNQCLYFIRSDVMQAKQVCDQINAHLGKGNSYQYAVVVVPRLLSVITSLFEAEGVYGNVTFGQYHYEMVPLDDHIVALQYENIVPSLWLHQETSYLASVARAIFNLKAIYGDFHHLVSIGNYSSSVIRMMEEYDRIYANDMETMARAESDLPTVIIMDRSMDFVSPCMTSLAYEGMLDEVIGIKGKTLTLNTAVTGKQGNLLLTTTSSDRVFEKIRKLHFSRVIPYLQSQARELKRAKEETAGLSVQAMKSFVENDLNNMKATQRSLSLHLDAVGYIVNQKSSDLRKQVDMEGKIIDNCSQSETKSFLEDAMAKNYDFSEIMKLLCLISLTQDGLKDYKSIKHQFVHSYGFRHAITLHNLEKMGLLHSYRGIEVNAKGVADAVLRVAPFTQSAQKDTRRLVYVPSLQNLVKKLVPPTNIAVSIDVPNHPSYVFNGAYTPFVAKITEEILSTLITPKTNPALLEKKLDDLMKFYQVSESRIKCKSASEAYARGHNVLVFVVGGITRCEIVSLQIVAKNTGFNIISGGTDITTGKKIVNSAVSFL